jgi:TetR/AcrR family transcriptional regulator
MGLREAVTTKKKQPAQHKRKRRSIGRPASVHESVGRDALLEKTCELLRELPPDKVTRAEVARYTNVDPSLIRYYFRDRASLLVAAAEKLTLEFARNLDKAVKHSDSSPRSLLRARIAALFELIVSHPYFHRLLIEEIVPSNAAAAKKMMDEMTQRSVAGYEAILVAGAKDGSLRRVSSAHLLLTVIGMCEFFIAGLPILKIALGRKFDDKAAGHEYVDFVCDLVLNGLAGPATVKSRAVA